MPNSLSAKKRVRQDSRRQSRNRWRKGQIKEQLKAFLSAIQDRDVAKAETEYRKTVSVLDRIASTGTIHKNNAARRKSRLSRRLKELKQATA